VNGQGDSSVPRPTLVAIASAGHSGSTLLDLLLGNHSQVCSAGEMNRLTLHAADRVCACGATVTACAFWDRVRLGLARARGRTDGLRWEDCHTDLPPQQPLLTVACSAGDLADGGTAPAAVRAGLQGLGVLLGADARLSRGGIRDFKWRLIDPAGGREFVLRAHDGRVAIYEADVRWKNPLRRMPEPLEIALALGLRTGLRAGRAFSPRIARYHGIAENTWAVAEAMAAVSGAGFVVDSSKSPLRLKLVHLLRPGHVRIVHLIRDGRAVAASAMRRRDMSAEIAARIWKRDNQNLAVMLWSIPARLKLPVRYEALCEDPERELRRICGFLGLEYEPGMTELWKRPVHNIPGNPMLFNRHQRAIHRDDRWRRDLSDGDLHAFARSAGRLNSSLGYV
jgi:hypothetical protein